MINPFANVFVFGVFNVHHKDWLTYSVGTDRAGELCYNFSISNDLTQMANFPTQIPDCDSHSLALLDLLISSDFFFLLAHLYFNYNLKNPYWYSIKQKWTFYYKQFSLKITKKTCYKGLKYCKFITKRNKAEKLMKKTILKGNIITYNEYKHKNTGTSVLIHSQNVEKQYH